MLVNLTKTIGINSLIIYDKLLKCGPSGFQIRDRYSFTQGLSCMETRNPSVSSLGGAGKEFHLPPDRRLGLIVIKFEIRRNAILPPRLLPAIPELSSFEGTYFLALLTNSRRASRESPSLQ